MGQEAAACMEDAPLLGTLRETETQAPGFSHGEASVDEVLIHQVGEFGRGQWLVLLVSGLGFISVACTMFLATFTIPSDPGQVPGTWVCSQSPGMDPMCYGVYSRLNNLALPQTHRVETIRHLLAAKPEDHTAHTHHHAAAAHVDGEPASFCDLSRDQYNWVNPHVSLATRYDLVCEHAWKAELLQTLFFTGVMTGNGLLGKAADVFGRKTMILGSCLGLLLTTLLSAVPPVFWMHAVMRVMSGAMAAGVALGGYVLVGEFVGPAWHGTAGMIAQTFFIFGELLLVGTAWLARGQGWVSLTLCTGVPPVLMGCLVWCVPESPRWLLTVGRKDEAESALHWVGTWNKAHSVARPCLASDPSCGGAGGQHGGGRGQPGSHGGALEMSGSVHGKSVTRSEMGAESAMGAGTGWSDSGRGDVPSRQLGSSPPPEKRPLIPASSIDLGCAARLEHVHSMKLLHADPSVALSDTLDMPVTVVAHAKDPGQGGASKVSNGKAGSDASSNEYWMSVDDQYEVAQRLLTTDDAQIQGEGIGKLLHHPLLARLLIVTIYTMWALSMAYFGVSLAASSLAGDLYLNFSLTAAAELPAYIMIILYVDNIGRKTVVLSGAAVAGAALVVVSLLPDDAAFLQVALAMVGKFGCSGAWAMGLIFTSELFPTSCRSAAVGIISQAGDMGGLLAPLLMLMAEHLTWTRLPFMVMGLLSFVASGMVAVLPETLGLPHSNTIKEMLAVLNSRPSKG